MNAQAKDPLKPWPKDGPAMPTPEQLAFFVEMLALDYAACENSFEHFFKAAWKILEPTTPLLFNWHHAIVCEYLQATLDGSIRRLIINMPPRYSKSILVTVMFPAWVWIKQPSKRFINASYAEALAVKHATDRRMLIQSPWYQAAWSNRFSFSNDQNQKTEYTNDKRGHCVAVGMLGTVTGRGGDWVIIDDAHNPKKAESDLERTASVDAFNSTFTTRLDNKKTGVIVIVMQRLHFQDLTGVLLEQNRTEDGLEWVHLCLPAEAPKRCLMKYPISGKRQVREQGELLHPEREGPVELAAAKKALGAYNYAGQYDQNPTPRAGGIFKKHYWRFYTRLPDKFDEQIQSWDFTFKDALSSDYVAGFAMARLGSSIYLLDLYLNQTGLRGSLNALVQMSINYPEAFLKLVENKANGPGIVDFLKSKISGLVLEEPQGNKMERAALVEPTFEAGNVYLPHPDLGKDWTQKVIDQCAQFPRGTNDDIVDALTQGVKRLQASDISRLIALGTY